MELSLKRMGGGGKYSEEYFTPTVTTTTVGVTQIQTLHCPLSRIPKQLVVLLEFAYTAEMNTTGGQVMASIHWNGSSNTADVLSLWGTLSGEYINCASYTMDTKITGNEVSFSREGIRFFNPVSYPNVKYKAIMYG